MPVTTTILSREYENNGSENKLNIIASMTGTYDQTTGVVLTAEELGLGLINRVKVGFDSTYVFKTSTALDKKSVTLRLFDSSLAIGFGPQLVYNSNIFVNTPDNTARLYHGAVAGGPFQVGETITGGTSLGTADVVSVGTDIHGNERLEVNNVAGGPFIAAEVITGGISGATATTSDQLHVTFDISGTLAAPIDLVEGDIAAVWTTLTKSETFDPALSVREYRYEPTAVFGQRVETLLSDNVSQLRASGIQMATSGFDSLQEVLTGFGVAGLGGVPIEVWGK